MLDPTLTVGELERVPLLPPEVAAEVERRVREAVGTGRPGRGRPALPCGTDSGTVQPAGGR